MNEEPVVTDATDKPDEKVALPTSEVLDALQIGSYFCWVNPAGANLIPEAQRMTTGRHMRALAVDPDDPAEVLEHVALIGGRAVIALTKPAKAKSAALTEMGFVFSHPQVAVK